MQSIARTKSFAVHNDLIAAIEAGVPHRFDSVAIFRGGHQGRGTVTKQKERVDYFFIIFWDDAFGRLCAQWLDFFVYHRGHSDHGGDPGEF